MLYLRTLIVIAGVIWAQVELRARENAPNADRPVLRIAYFIPSDRKAEPDFRERIDRIMTEVQRFYRVGMERNGFGPISFELDRDQNGALRIDEVRGRGPMHDYGRDASAKVRGEVKQALAEKNLDLDHETIVIFQLLLAWRGNRAVEIGPYVGGGGPRSGTAWVFDDAKLDTKLLASREPGGFYHRPCSLGQFNTHYIGGIAHELGHALGLPHDCEPEIDRPRLGRSLMGGGNHTYGEEQRGEGPGAFLSAASALPLSVHPLFTGRRQAKAPMTCRLTELQAVYEGGKLCLAGRLEEGPRAIGLVAHNDSRQTPGNYDAVGWTCKVDVEGRFRLVIGELLTGEYDLRLTAYAESGDSRTVTLQYRVDDDGHPDLQPFAERTTMRQAYAAFQDRNAERLTEIVTDLQKREAQGPLVKVEHLKKLLTPPAPISLATVAPDKMTFSMADLELEAAQVGWGKPVRNQVLAAEDAGCLLEVGATFYESGLYAHAPARHALRLDGHWNRLTTKFGLQDRHDGSVVFVIKGDGQELFRSPVVRDHVPRAQAVDVANVKLLELLVEDAGDGNRGDWGVWLEPQLHREPSP